MNQPVELIEEFTVLNLTDTQYHAYLTSGLAVEYADSLTLTTIGAKLEDPFIRNETTLNNINEARDLLKLVQVMLIAAGDEIDLCDRSPQGLSALINIVVDKITIPRTRQLSLVE